MRRITITVPHTVRVIEIMDLPDDEAMLTRELAKQRQELRALVDQCVDQCYEREREKLRRETTDRGNSKPKEEGGG